MEEAHPATAPRPLVGFTGHGSWPTGIVTPPFKWICHDGTKHITRALEFLVVDHLADQNILLGRPILFQLQAAPSTLNGALKISTNDRSTMVVATKLGNGCDAQRERKHET